MAGSARGDGGSGDGRSARTVGSVARAAALLDALADSEGGLGVNALARRIGVSPSTASRLLGTLQDAGLVDRADGGSFQLGLKLVSLSDRVLTGLDVRERARPLLVELVEATGETATLSVPGGGEATTIDFLVAPSSVVSMAWVGRPSVGHATAVGKVMLAFAADGTRTPAPLRLTAFTERTITDPRALAAELASVRERGYAEAFGEREPDLGAVAVPVSGRGARLEAILGVQAPISRLGPPRSLAVRTALLTAARQLGRALGGAPGH